MSHFNRSKFTSWFLAAFAFGIWAVAIDCLWTRLVINHGTASEAARISHLIRENGSEIPIFGTSKAAEDYVPEIMGDDVFNYGMVGTTMDLSYALLQIECKKHKQTPIVLDLPHPGLRRIGDPSKFAPFTRQPEIRQMMDRVGLMEWRYRVPGLRYFGYYDWYLRYYLAENIFHVSGVVHGHAVPLDKPFDRRALDKDISLRLKEGYGFSSDPEQDRILFDVISNTPQRTFVIVVSPVHSSCFANFRNSEGLVRYLGKLRSFTNVVVLDWGRMELADDCFKDTQHLNARGAAEFSRRLADELRRIRPSPSSSKRADQNAPAPVSKLKQLEQAATGFHKKFAEPLNSRRNPAAG
jgi:hypothetical protein